MARFVLDLLASTDQRQSEPQQYPAKTNADVGVGDGGA